MFRELAGSNEGKPVVKKFLVACALALSAVGVGVAVSASNSPTGCCGALQHFQLKKLLTIKREWLIGTGTETRAPIASMATTTVDLFRCGNSTSARLDHIRNTDVDIYTDTAIDELCAKTASEKGISTWDKSGSLTHLGGRIWRLPANSTYDDTLLELWETSPGSGKWLWSPASNMRGSEYVKELGTVNALFV
jgi:hypothetical protein